MADICKHNIETKYCGYCNQDIGEKTSQSSSETKEEKTGTQERPLVSLQALANLLRYKDTKFIQLKRAVLEKKIPEPVKVDAVSMYFDKEQIDDFIQNVIGAEIKDEPFITNEDAIEVLGITYAELIFLRKTSAIPYYELRLGEGRSKVLYRRSEILAAQKISLHWNGDFYIKNERIRAYEKILSFLLQISEVKEYVLTEKEYFVCQSLFEEAKGKKFLQKELNVSRERIRQIFESAVRNIKDWVLNGFSERNEKLNTREEALDLREKEINVRVEKLLDEAKSQMSGIKKIEEEREQLREGIDRLKAEKNNLIHEIAYLENLMLEAQNRNLDVISSSVEERLQEIRKIKLNENLASLAHASRLGLVSVRCLHSLSLLYPTLRSFLQLSKKEFRLLREVRGNTRFEIEKWIEDMGFVFGMKDEN